MLLVMNKRNGEKKMKAIKAEENKQYWSKNDHCVVEAKYSPENGGTWFWAFQGGTELYIPGMPEIETEE